MSMCLKFRITRPPARRVGESVSEEARQPRGADTSLTIRRAQRSLLRHHPQAGQLLSAVSGSGLQACSSSSGPQAVIPLPRWRVEAGCRTCPPPAAYHSAAPMRL